MQAVSTPGELRDLPSRRRGIGRPVQQLAFEREHLVGAENHTPRPAAAHGERLLGREPARQSSRIARRGSLDRPLIDARRLGFDRQPRRFEQPAAGRARRGEKQRLERTPERAHTAMNFMRWSR
jgi:hypothetical protein